MYLLKICISILVCFMIIITIIGMVMQSLRDFLFSIMPYIQETSASLCFRGQRIFLHNAHGSFGDVPLEASGDFGIHPDEGEFHVMCQVF